MLDMKNTIREMNAFDGITSRLDIAEEGICELEDLTIEFSKIEE
jgi:hypothetical protein